MKQVILKVLSFVRNFFISLRIHLHVGIYRDEISEKDKKSDDM